MHKISQIVGTMAKHDKEGNEYWKTLAIDEEGTELWGFSNEPYYYQVGDSIMTFYDDAHNQAKMVKPKETK